MTTRSFYPHPKLSPGLILSGDIRYLGLGRSRHAQNLFLRNLDVSLRAFLLLFLFDFPPPGQDMVHHLFVEPIKWL